jgi:TetR/AcrR family transcriptional repressor of mexJK operon
MGVSMAESTTLRRQASVQGEGERLSAEKTRPDKHSAITRAASEMFLSEGFDRASLDQIAQRAGVSKQTIYSHFADKEALFKAICTELTEKLTIPLRNALPSEGSLREILLRLGENTLAMMLRPASLDLHRLVLNAAARFPELGRTAFEAGATRMMEDLSALLTQRSQLRDGLGRTVSADEARLLAEQFIGMLRGAHQQRALLGVKPVSPQARRDYVRACVDLLLRAV